MKFKFFGLLMTLILCFSACTNELLNDKAVEGIALRKGSSTVVWNGDADKAVAQNIDEVKNDTRKNASGAKITSNAHSADFPGIYFIWDSKQKDNGYLKVSADVFDAYESFVLTAKESNTYWDFTIALQAGQQKTDDNCYVFYIPKVYNNKNINMVFLSEWKGIEVVVTNEPPTILDEPVIKGKLSFKKIVQDSEGVAQEWSDWDAFEFELLDGDETIANAKAVDGVVTFESDKIIPGKSYTVKEIISGSEELFEVVSEEFTANQVVTINSSSRPSSAAIVDPDDIWEILSGYKIKAFWQNEIKNQDDLAAMMAITVDGVAPTWIWDIENPWAYGVTGSESIIYINNINIDGEIVGDEVPFYFAADNAAVLFVNGQVAGYTEKSFAATGTTPGDDFTFTGFSDKDFGDLIEHWSWVYVKDIKPFLKQGNNVIKIAAANNDESDGKYDQTNNPAGLIFATTFEVAKGGKDNVFVNKLKPIEPVCNIDNSKLVEVVNEAKTLYNNECYETGALEALVAEAESYSGCEQDVIDGYTNSIRETIDNLIDYCAVGGAMSSVTATNDAGAPHVANNNNFTFAVIDRADLENGVELDLVLGAKYVKVGTVSVILNSDGNIEITGIKDVDGKSVSAQSYGMLAYNQEIEYGTNLNPLLKHDNESVESPEGDTIYLYIHFDNLQFFLNK